MTKQEFEQHLNEVNDTVKALAFEVSDEMRSNLRTLTVSNEDYKKIDFVYAFYPYISETCGKEQIAMIYLLGGMAVINDMCNRASRAHDMELEIHEAHSIITNANVSLDLLKHGKESEEM